MLIRELLTEAAYDSMVDAMRRQFPEQDQFIMDQVRWAKQALKKPDRITWYLRILRAALSDELGPELLGSYRWRGIQQLGADITHFFGYNYPPIDNYVFQRQTVTDIITDLKKLEKEWQEKQDKERGVDAQEGDHKLFEFGDGTAWWWVDRAHCPEEGRSGDHCGNVTGLEKTDQRILSLRNRQNQVILTFILEPDGRLGEMKAKHNLKPQPKYHPQIMKLLLWDRVTGIQGQGYAPDRNFNVFDLDPQNLEYIDRTKPQLIADQVKLTPMLLLRSSSAEIKQKYMNSLPDYVQRVIIDPTDKNWSWAVRNDPSLIIQAPDTIPNFEKLAVKYFKDVNGEYQSEDDETYLASQEMAQSSPAISKNVDLLRKILSVNGLAIGGVNRNIKGYPELCMIAVNSHSSAFSMVPDDVKTEKMAEVAVMDNVWMVKDIPDNLKSEKLYIHAVNANPEALYFVPEEFKTEQVCIAAVRHDDRWLEDVPEKLKSIVANRMGIKYEDS